jgi:hypothetical protein
MRKDAMFCVGAGRSQIPYIEKIKQMGYFVICADQNPYSEGFPLANVHLVVSTYDGNALISKIIEAAIEEDFNIVGVIAPCTGPPFKTRNMLRKYFSLRYYHNDTVNILLDKYLLRTELNKIKVSDITILHPLDEINSESFPLVKKPRFNGLGGKGVEKFRDINQYFNCIKNTSLDNDFVYESYINGPEFAIDAVWDGNKIIFLSIGWSFFERETGTMIGSSSESNLRLNIFTPVIEDYIERICHHFQLGPEVLNIDAVLTRDNQIEIIEVEFVPADVLIHGEICFNYDMVDNFIRCSIGKELKNPEKRINNSIIIADVFEKTYLDKESITLFSHAVNPFNIRLGDEDKEVIKFVSFSSARSEDLDNYIKTNLSMITKKRKFYVR